MTKRKPWTVDDPKNEIRRLRMLVKALGNMHGTRGVVIELDSHEGANTIIVCAPQWIDEKALVLIAADTFNAVLTAAGKMKDEESKEEPTP